MLRLFGDTRIDFVGFRRKAFFISGILLLVGIISVVVQGGFYYGVDFTGGALVLIRFEKPVSVDELRSLFGEKAFPCESIQDAGDNSYYIRVGLEGAEKGGVGARIKEILKSAYPDNEVVVEKEDVVGPAVSEGLRWRAVWVVLLGMVGILIYVSFRFAFIFGIAAVIALFHDVLITLGLLSLLHKEINIPIVAALLFIVGYSINDSIVVSDRIRENRKLLRDKSWPEMVNVSINQTLSRTVITSLTTIMVLLCLYLFGGKVIHDFAFTLLWGVIVGTYSSIFVVAPIVVEWQELQKAKKSGGKRTEKRSKKGGKRKK